MTSAARFALLSALIPILLAGSRSGAPPESSSPSVQAPAATVADACHGHTHAILWDGQTVMMYHYHATSEYPYSIGCFAGPPAKTALGGRPQDNGPRNGPPRGGPPNGPPGDGAPPGFGPPPE